MQKEQKSASDLNKKREAAVQKQEKLRSDIGELAFNEEEFNSLEQEKDHLTSSVSELTDLVDTLSARLGSRLAFKYSDPVRGFDRSKVKGLVAKLIKVKQAAHSTALEVVAGGKLYQVVVDEAITGKALLDRGKLERRVTIIPLDKIQGRRVTGGAADKARSIAQSMNAGAWPAIELVGFDEEVQTAMEYVFGSSIVVDGAKAANQICDATKTRTVTLDGDVYDPSGTISGGSRNNLGSTLAELTKLSEASANLSEQKKRLLVVRSQLDTLKTNLAMYEKLSTRLEFAEAELQGIQKHLSQTSYGVLEEKFNAMSKELEEAQQLSDEMQKEQGEKWVLYHELKDREVELTQDRENRLGQIEKAVKEAKKDAAEKAKASREAESRWQTLSLEKESLKSDVVAAEEGVAVAQAALKEASNEEDNREIKVGEVKALYDDAKAALAEFENRLAQCSSELSEIKRQRTALAKQAEACALEGKKLSVAISRVQKERHTAEKVVANLLKNHTWIESEKSAFGVEDGDYDFQATDPSEMSRLLQALKSEQESLVSIRVKVGQHLIQTSYTLYLY
jgi:structural maintenance of chromosome 2